MKCVLIFSFIILVSSSPDCPSSKWFKFRNKCYLADTSKSYSFQQNVDFCKSFNATTVSIHSKEENDFVTSTLSVGHYYWLGIRQVDFKRQTYAWLDGSLYNYSNWFERNGEKSCAGAFLEVTGFWRDWLNCHDTNRAICQIDFDSPIYIIKPQITESSKDLEQMKAQEIRFNETIARMNKALNIQSALIKNMTSNSQAELRKMDIRIHGTNKEMAGIYLILSSIKDAINTQNGLKHEATSIFEAKLKRK